MITQYKTNKNTKIISYLEKFRFQKRIRNKQNKEHKNKIQKQVNSSQKININSIKSCSYKNRLNTLNFNEKLFINPPVIIFLEYYSFFYGLAE